MKILYDHQIFANQIYGGVSRYFYELMSAFSKNKAIDFDLSLTYSNNQYLENAHFAAYHPFFRNINFRGKNRILDLINKQESKKMLTEQDFDIFHPTYYNPYFLNSIGNKPFVLTIYDAIHEIYPKIFKIHDKTSQNKKLLARKAAKIIAISKNTKKDIIRLFNIDEKKIEVIYLGNSLGSNIQDKALNSIPNLPQTYVLFVGNRRGYKNFDLFIKAISGILKEDSELCVVCAGGSRFTQSEINTLKELDILRKVFQRPVTDETLARLYKGSIALIFPSLYEGFGIPVLEAFAYGCPVIVSNSSSFPEIAEEAAYYFDPNSELSICQAIKRIINDGELRKSLISKGYEQVKKFSWKKTAMQTKSLYESIL